MKKGNNFVDKLVFSVSSSVTSLIYMNIKLHITSFFFLFLWDVVGS